MDVLCREVFVAKYCSLIMLLNNETLLEIKAFCPLAIKYVPHGTSIQPVGEATPGHQRKCK